MAKRLERCKDSNGKYSYQLKDINCSNSENSLNINLESITELLLSINNNLGKIHREIYKEVKFDAIV